MDSGGGTSKNNAAADLSVVGWIAAASVTAIIFYQFPKSRGVLTGLILLTVLGATLRHYGTIRKEIISITKG